MTDTSWVEGAPVVAASLLLLISPGLALAYALGMRGLWAAAVSPLFTTTMFVVASILLPLFGLPWTLTSALIGASLFGVLVWVLFRFVLKIRFVRLTQATSTVALIGAWVLIALPVGAILVYATATAGAISQTYDSIFHLNLIAHILDVGNASPLVAGEIVRPDAATALYPNAWNMLVSLVAMTTGTTIPVAVNSLNLALALLVWPAGILLLVRQLIGPSNVAMWATGVFAAGLTAFPLYLLYYGVLYPFYLGMLFVPVVISVLLQILRLSREARITRPVGLMLILLGLLPALLVAHPGAAMAVLALTVPVVFVAVFSGFRSLSSSKKVWRAGLLVAFVAAGLYLLVELRPSYNWGPKTTMVEAALQAVTLSLRGYGLPLAIALAAATGLCFAFYRRKPVMLATAGIAAMGALMYFIAAGVPYWTPRVLALGAWYSDTPRLAAIYAVAVIPLAAGGVVWAIEGTRLRTMPRAAAVLAVTLGILAVQLSAGWQTFVPKLRVSHTATSDARLLSPDELALIERLPEIVPKDSVIAGNPWTGTSLAYALADRSVIMPHVQTTLSDNAEVLMNQLRWADSRPEVCAAAQALNVQYVLDFGLHEVHGDRHEFPGIERLTTSTAVELVASEGRARLYQLTACG